MTRRRPIDTYLSQHPLFAGCSKRQLRELSGLTTAVRLRAGRLLGRQGDLSEELILLVRGRVAAEIDGEIVRTFEPGEIVSETTEHERPTRPATVYAATDVDAKVISQQELRSMLDIAPRLAEALKIRTAPGGVPHNADHSPARDNRKDTRAPTESGLSPSSTN